MKGQRYIIAAAGGMGKFPEEYRAGPLGMMEAVDRLDQSPEPTPEFWPTRIDDLATGPPKVFSQVRPSE
jgi:hypothetical protein